MTSDGTNSYSWDAENRLIKVTYPGSGNNSQFSYDGFGRNVSIVETVSGSVTSTKMFVWSSDKFRQFRPCEARNSSSSVTAQYFPLGETISGTSYFYTSDHLGLTQSEITASDFSSSDVLDDHPDGFNPILEVGSTREMTNSSGALQSQLSYDAFGRPTQLQGSTSPDFQYAGYYFHSPSGLGLTLARAYSGSLGRFLGRDIVEEDDEDVGPNRYAYVLNNPTSFVDPLGMESVARTTDLEFQCGCS
jgi:RHS repeat-associated protein